MMIGRWIRKTTGALWPRASIRAMVLLTICLLLLGALAPASAGAQEAGPTASTTPVTQPTTYRYAGQPDGTTEVQRSMDAGLTWLAIGMIPEPVAQLEVNPADDTVVFARTGTSLWRSGNSGVGWAQVDSLPDRPLTLAFAGSSEHFGLIFAGADTQGLFSSLDGGTSWQAAGGSLSSLGAGSLAVTALAVDPGNPDVIYAAVTFTMATPEGRHSLQSVFISDDAGASWTQTGALPSRLLALAVARGTPGLVFIGTESVGLLRSNDGGVSWQPVDSAVLARGHAAPFAVTALAFDPEDAQIVYAATSIWLGTSTTRLIPLGVVVSVDGGRQWIQMSRAQLSDTPVQRLEPVAGRPLMVMEVNSTGSNVVGLELSPELSALLQSENPAVRASAARALGLIGDPAALPDLMQALADPDALAGQRAAEAIGRIGDRSVSAELLKMLTTAPASERTRVALALGLLKSEEAVPGLAALLSAGDPEAQRVAAEALAGIGTSSAMVALVAPLADEQMTSARHAAMGGLETAGRIAVTPLRLALTDSSPLVRRNAAEALGWLSPVEDPLQRADTMTDLSRLLSDPNYAVQAQAAWALGEIGGEPASLALNPAPVVAAPVQRAELPVAPTLLAALPGAHVDVASNHWTAAAMSAILVLMMLVLLARMLIWIGPRHHLRPS